MNDLVVLRHAAHERGQIRSSPGGRTATVLLAGVVAAAGGCGSGLRTHPVEGTVTTHEGRPLAGAQVIWQRIDPPLTATAITDESGRYRVGTRRPADGAPPGRYRVKLVEPQADDIDAAPAERIPRRYRALESSGLERTVEAGRNRFDIRLEPPP
jgi:hypothetical protein